MQEPVLATVAEEVVNLEFVPVLAAIGADHQHQIGPEGRAQPLRQRGDVASGNLTAQLAVPMATQCGDTARELLSHGGRKVLEGRHGPTTSVICVSRLASGAGAKSPRSTSAAIERASGTRLQDAPSPDTTPAGGGPYSIRFAWAMNPTAATVSRASTSPMSAGRPTTKPARSSANSDTNSPNGGKPTRASPPVRKSQPVPGITWRTTETRAMSAVRYRWRMRPAARNIEDFASAWFTRCSIAAPVPRGPSVSPTHIRPMCSMLE